jgi:hypothetical protein
VHSEYLLNEKMDHEFNYQVSVGFINHWIYILKHKRDTLPKLTELSQGPTAGKWQGYVVTGPHS